MIDLLAPVGDFECLKAAVQNGADSVYFGAEIFSARAFAHNFSIEELKEAIEYAKIRDVKTNLTLNTLMKNSELDQAIQLAIKTYEFGIDAIIVQDLGLAMKLLKLLPDLPIHASTQMTVHNLDGALKLQELGFKRVVLSRELSIDEISYISKNTNIEIECFIHGALCVSYSGQCLFSSMIGGRSGNRGKCAGPCRLSYDLFENKDKIDSGYLLNTKDLCGLNYITEMINAGVHCLKIEGRMKSPEYVATVTRIYKKYINLALTNKSYIIDEADRNDLIQVFNRGMSSTGHLANEPNKQLVYKEKPNHMGLLLGNVLKYNKNKGYITLKLKEKISIGDKISFKNDSKSYTISELMKNNNNIKETQINQTVTIGRIKGNINIGDKIYKISSKELIAKAKNSYINSENRKIPLDCSISIKKDLPISINITSTSDLPEYKDLNITCSIPYSPEVALKHPLNKEAVIKQISKTNSTPYYFNKINIDLDNNIFLSKISILNELRRLSLENVYKYAVSKINRKLPDCILNLNNNRKLNANKSVQNNSSICVTSKSPKISLLLNIIDSTYNYQKLEKIDNIYIPLKYFFNNKYENILQNLTKKAEMFIYFPTIFKENYKNLLYKNLNEILKKYKIKGFVISHIGNIKMLYDLLKNTIENYELISNYTFNVYNTETVLQLKNQNISRFTISPESDSKLIEDLCNSNYLQKELIVYGKTPVLNMNYCLLGKSNKCYPECNQNCKNKCNSKSSYYLKDRLNMNFEVLPDNIQTVTTVFNSKITSILPTAYRTDFARIDILHEYIDDINKIIKTVKSGNRFEGKDYTNGNLNRSI